MRKHRLIPLLLVLVLALSLSACGNGATKTEDTPADKEVAEEKVEIYVLAAASLTDVMGELQTLYNEENPNTEIIFSFDSSGTLQQQIEEGAPADVFVSAAQKQMDTLEEKDLVASDTRADLLKNTVVLIVPADSETTISKFEDVLNDDVKMIAIGESSVPVGQYTEKIYTHLGIWDQVKAKANFGTNVRNVLAWVEEKQADCGVVYATDAAITDKVKVVAEAPEGSHDPVIYPAAVLKNAAQPEASKSFLDFLQTEEAAKVFEKYGFTMAQ